MSGPQVRLIARGTLKSTVTKLPPTKLPPRLVLGRQGIPVLPHRPHRRIGLRSPRQRPHLRKVSSRGRCAQRMVRTSESPQPTTGAGLRCAAGRCLVFARFSHWRCWRALSHAGEERAGGDRNLSKPVIPSHIEDLERGRFGCLKLATARPKSRSTRPISRCCSTGSTAELAADDQPPTTCAPRSSPVGTAALWQFSQITAQLRDRMPQLPTTASGSSLRSSAPRGK